jgi:hypothetical protein
MDYKGLLIGFFVGLITEFLADYLIRRFRAKKNKRQLGDLEGYWVEIIKEQSERTLSIAKFDFNDFSLEYQLDGTNYFNDGRAYYEWTTEETIFKPNVKKILYFYTVVQNGSIHEQKHGFGVIRLDKLNKKWTMKNGYFVDAGDEKNPRHINFMRIEAAADKLNFKIDLSNKENISEFVRTMFNNMDKFKNI